MRGTTPTTVVSCAAQLPHFLSCASTWRRCWPGHQAPSPQRWEVVLFAAFFVGFTTTHDSARSTGVSMLLGPEVVLKTQKLFVPSVVRSPSRIESCIAALSAGKTPASSYALVASRWPTLRSLECACASSLQHFAQSPCSKRSTGKQQSLRNPCLKGQRCKQDAIHQYETEYRHRSGLLGPLTCLSQVLRQCRGRYWQAELTQLQGPSSLPVNSRFYQHPMGEQLSSKARVAFAPKRLLTGLFC